MGTRYGLALLLVLASVTLQRAAIAAEPTATDRETARALLFEGREKLEAGDALGALKLFRAAHAIMGVPTTGLDVAKAHAALGQLVEARAVALEVTRIPAKAGEPEAFTNARTAAEQLAAELAERIPSLEIRVQGLPATPAPKVTVDGSTLSPEAVGLPRKMNPGKHTVEVTAPGYTPAKQTVTLKEREKMPLEVSLRLAGAPADPESPGAPPLGSSGENPTTPSDLAADEDRGQSVPVWAWTSGAAGLVALGVGIAFAVDYTSVRSTVAEDCPKNACDSRRYNEEGLQDLSARWNRDLGLSVGLGLVGLAGIGVAVYGLVSASDAKPSQARALPGSVALWIPEGGAGATLRYAF